MALTDGQITIIVREAAKGSALRRDGSTTNRIARAIESAATAPLLERIAALEAQVEQSEKVAYCHARDAKEQTLKDAQVEQAAQPVYQVREAFVDDPAGKWRDTWEGPFYMVPEADRRIVYTSPPKAAPLTEAATDVLLAQRDGLRAALVKVLDTREKDAQATMRFQNAHDNFSDSAKERKEHEKAMLAAGNAEREARMLLLTLRTADESIGTPATVEKEVE